MKNRCEDELALASRLNNHYDVMITHGLKNIMEKHKKAIKLQEIAKIKPTSGNKIAASNANKKAVEAYWEHVWDNFTTIRHAYETWCPDYFPDSWLDDEDLSDYRDFQPSIDDSIAALDRDIEAFHKYKSNPKDENAKKLYETTSDTVMHLMKGVPMDLADAMAEVAEFQHDMIYFKDDLKNFLRRRRGEWDE